VIQINSIGDNSEITAEQSVLGAILLDANALDNITFLEDRDFALVRHQQIYKVMRQLEKRGKPVDFVTIADRFSDHIESIGGVSYLSQLASACPTAANVEYYARLVRSKALERRTQNLGQIITGINRDDFESDEEFFSQIENLVAEMRPKENAKMLSFSETKEKYFQHLAKKAEYIKTGFAQFDNWAKGLWRGWLFVSAGRPSVGKTAMLLQRLFGVAKQHDGVVLLFSQEMDDDSLKDRFLSQTTNINYQKIKSKTLSDQEKEMLKMGYEEFEYLPIFIQDSAGVTIDEVRATARQFKKKHGKIAAIAVDYLQIMNIPKIKGETRAEAIGRVTGEAKRIAREYNCCFIMLSQMSRDFEKSASKPQLSHLKESGSIEQDADVVEFLWHDPNDMENGGKVIQQTIAKGRDTGLNEFRLLFKGWVQRFDELPRK
jgi:replicative DNA helicase